MTDDTVLPNDIVVTVKSLAYGGEAVAVIEQDPKNPAAIVGKKAFVRDAIPGEKVSVTCEKDNGSYFEASLLSVLSPSPERQLPPCRYVPYCGGCDYQHITTNAQRSFKREMVERSLAIQGKIALPRSGVELVGETLPGFNYRRRVVLHIDEFGRIGFFARKTSTVVPIEECLLCTSSLNAAIKELLPRGEMLARYFSSVSVQEFEDDVLFGFKLSDGVLIEKVQTHDLLTVFKVFSILKDHEIVFHGEHGVQKKELLPTAAFSQVNEDGNALLVDEVVRAAKNCTSLTEFYAGSGNFTIPLAKSGIAITAIELDTRLTDYGSICAVKEKVLEKVTFKNFSAEKYVKSVPLSGDVLLDPPRSGAKIVCEAINPKKTKKVIYVSCNLPSLMRDLKILIGKGFELNSLKVLDMFSQTHHVEVIACLQAR